MRNWIYAAYRGWLGFDAVGRSTGQWRCRICGLDRWLVVTVKRKNGALYTTSFYARSHCSAMILNPEQFNAFDDAAPNVEMPTVIALPARWKSLVSGRIRGFLV